MAQKKQVFNPYLPLNQYVPDGEPHVFGDRLYVFGSHDKEAGNFFCLLDYEGFSAPVGDLSDWRSEGILYRANQDPLYSKRYRYLYAPDVVQGNDGRYYLYYALAGEGFTAPIHVAVCDAPAGAYAYYGAVQNKDGTPYTRKITFDPGVLNDNGTIRLYYGWSLAVPGEVPPMTGDSPEAAAARKNLLDAEVKLFEKPAEEILAEPDGIMGAYTVELANDMLTVLTEPKRIVPGQFDAQGTGFAQHAFFEASSIRRIGVRYYFIYSSQHQHELCYATSLYPDREFVFGGTIISNGDIGIRNRKPEDRVAFTGNNHGSIVCVQGQWYVFYHRHTHKTMFSRQGCAEKIALLPDGRIPQVSMTSCGLNDGPLKAQGSYPAVIACVLTNGQMPHAENRIYENIPYITNEGEQRFIADIGDGTEIGYRFFAFTGAARLALQLRGSAAGVLSVFVGEEKAAELAIEPARDWVRVSCAFAAVGTHALTLRYRGAGTLDLQELAFR